MRLTHGLVFPSVLLFFVACGDDDSSCVPSDTVTCGDPTDGGMDASPDGGPDAGPNETGCNPVGDGEDCLLPFPSDVFMIDDATTESGKRMTFSEEALLTWDDDTFDPTRLYAPDGFSVGSQIMFGFAEAAEEDQFVGRFEDYATTLTTDSPTLLIDASTGEFVAHFAEIDARDATDNPINFIRPAARLAYERRYVVVVQGLRRAAGGAMPATEGFAAVRDSADGVDAELQAHYDDDIFPLIEAAGVERADVQLAWDFTTGSGASVKKRMLSMRDAMHTWLAENDPTVTVTSVEAHDSPDIAVQVQGTITVPAFVDSAEPGARLLETPDLSTTFDVPFWANIPQSVADGDLPGRAVQFGHGFFGTHEEIDGSFSTAFANTYGFVHFVVEWWGMSSPDQGKVVGTIMGDSSSTSAFGERVQQAMANQLALTDAIKTSLAAHEAFQSNEQPIYDTQNVYFYGISQGAILGATFLSLSNDIHRAALSVGAANLSLIMSRSANFSPFLAVIAFEVKTSRRVQELSAMLQISLDLIDPHTYFEEFGARMQDDERPLVVAFHGGLGDIQVPNVALEYQVRSLGIPTLAPVEYTYYDQQTVEGPTAASALTLFDFGTDPLPGSRAEAQTEGTPAHGETRKTTASQEQLDGLFQPDGQIEQTCEGVCDPE